MLTSYIYGLRASDAAMNDTHIFDPLKILPISDSETTIILCANALKHYNKSTPITLNAIFLRYGFQVSYYKHKG